MRGVEVINMIYRPRYIDELLKYKDLQLVKILSGIRRCGKSTILAMYKQKLLDMGVREQNIIERAYTSMSLSNEFDAKVMYKELVARISERGKVYLLLDEVQEIVGWEKVINSILEEFNVDIYVTGSNSKLMASEISTYLTGRFVTIPIYTLSFKEYLEFKQSEKNNIKECFRKYLENGGFPIVALTDMSRNDSYQIVEGIYSTVITNDIARRHKIQNRELFDRVVLFIMENMGKTFSANSIVNFLKSEQRKTNVETIYNYLKWLTEAFVIYKCSRYDIQGKSVLKTQEKYYLADISLKYSVMGYNPKGVASSLENIVFLELKRRGYDVYIGKNATKEIDFVAERRDEKIYIQVCRNLPEESDRETKNLLEIRDAYPKYVVTADPYIVGNYEGIQIMQIEDFLLKSNY